MQRFLAMRLLSKNHITSTPTSYTISNPSVSLAKTSPLQYSTVTLSNPPAKPKIFLGFFANPVVVNKVLQRSNAMLKAQNKGILDFKWLFSKIYSWQKHSHYRSSYNSHSTFRKRLQSTDPRKLIRRLVAANVAIFLLSQGATDQFKRRNFMMGGMSPSSMPGLGTSGAVTAIMLLDMCLTRPKMLIIGLPNPAILLGIYLIMHDMSRKIEGDTRVSRSAHLGGAAVAWVFRKRCRKLVFHH